MNVAWVISEEIADGLIDPAVLNATAESWGSWKVWQEYKLNNCVCTSQSTTTQLITRGFHEACNLYIMESSYISAGSPPGVKLFGGEFKSSTISNQDDIVALNLAVNNVDLVLMSGFDFHPMLNTDDTELRKSREEYYFNIRNIMLVNAQTQFVLIDYDHKLAGWATELDNLTSDTVDSVVSLLA